MSNKQSIHSERSFGLLFSFLGFCFYLHDLFLKGLNNNNFLYFSIIFLFISLFFPKLLYYPNLVWFKLGNTLHKIISPFIMLLIFGIVVTPTGILFKLFSYDPLNTKFDNRTDSYWVKRKNSKVNFSDQF